MVYSVGSGTGSVPTRDSSLLFLKMPQVEDLHVRYMEIHVHSTLAKEYNGRKVIPTQTNKGTHICTCTFRFTPVVK